MRRQINKNWRTSSVQILGIFLFGLLCDPAAIHAADGSWMFRRSYFTHQDDCCGEVNYPKPVSRSAYRPAYVGSTSQFSFRGGYRINRVHIRGAGPTWDTTIRQEGWGASYGPPVGP